MRLPDGPTLPAPLQTAWIIANPIGFLENYCAPRYGDTFTLRVLGAQSPPVVFFSHPQSIQAIFTTVAHQFELGKITYVFRPLTGDQSLIMQDGSRHQHQRQMLMPALHGDRLTQWGTHIWQIAQTATDDWQPGAALNIREQMSDIALEVILRVVFGLRAGERYRRLKPLLHHLLESVTQPLNSVQFFLPPLQQNLGQWSPWGRFLRQRQQIDDLIYAEIAARRQHGVDDRTDILSMLMTATDEQGQLLSDVELRDQLMTLLLLGHETTASGLTWAFYWLYQRPQMLERLQAELAALGPDPDPVVVAQQPYLTAVCKEALRVYPIALIAQPRRVKQTVHLEGYEFEPGAVLVPCIYLAHRRSETYPNPKDFQPDRFLTRKFSPYEYLPFGGGNRSCIGMALSLFEMKLVLAAIVSRYRLAFTAPVPPTLHPVRRGITFVPPKFRLSVLETAKTPVLMA